MRHIKYNKKLQEALDARAYKKGHKPPPEQVIFRIKDRVVGSLQNFVCFSGLPKAGKSTFLNATVASAFSTWPIYGIELSPPINRPVIGYIDTESGEYDFYRSTDRIKQFMGLPELPDNLMPFTFRNADPEEIKQSIEYFLSVVPNCSVIIIDGLLDLLLDYNNVMESRLLLNWIKKITADFDVLCIGVVHVGKKDGNTLGHFGSMLDRYCQSIIKVEKDKEKQVFTLSPQLMRSDGDFSKIGLANNDGQFVEVF